MATRIVPYVLVRWTASKTGDALYMYAGETLKFIINDDLTALVGHFANCQGVKV